MDFNFSKPSIHGVLNITASTTICNKGLEGEFACLHLIFHGAADEPVELEAYFKRPHVAQALKLEAIINSLTPQAVEDDAA